jgi:hypothetical protein
VHRVVDAELAGAAKPGVDLGRDAVRSGIACCAALVRTAASMVRRANAAR